MRDQVTTTIDPYLKQLYEVLKDKIGKNYRQILEEGIRREIEKCDPIPLLKHDIAQGDLVQEERRQLLTRLEFNQSQMQQPQQQKGKDAKESQELQRLRLEIFEKDIKTYARQIKDNKINWLRIIELGKFSDLKEAKKWLEEELRKNDLLSKSHHFSR